jgi:hypothetical protein
MDDPARSIRTVREGHLTQGAETMHADLRKGTWMQFKGKLNLASIAAGFRATTSIVKTHIQREEGTVNGK